MCLPIREGVKHFHVWVRSGRVFTMRPRFYESRHTATSVARRLRPNAADRLVLGCEACPATRPSKRKAPRWGAIARRLAARFELPAGEVREALAAEFAAERGRDVPAGRGERHASPTPSRTGEVRVPAGAG